MLACFVSSVYNDQIVKHNASDFYSHNHAQSLSSYVKCTFHVDIEIGNQCKNF